MNNGKEMKAKIGVKIYLLEDGNIAYESTSNNLISIVGLLETAKKLIMDEGNQKEESRIVKPESRI